MLEVGRQALTDLGIDPSLFDSTATDVAAYPDDRSLKVAVSIMDETQKQLRASISQGLAADETADELRARVEVVFGAALTYRADRIAQTEITAAQGFGDVSAWKQTDVVRGKEWYTAEDELVCPFCSGMDGLIVALDEYFFRQGDRIDAGGESMTVGFGDIVSPPLHVNCRCVLMPVRVS